MKHFLLPWGILIMLIAEACCFFFQFTRSLLEVLLHGGGRCLLYFSAWENQADLEVLWPKFEDKHIFLLCEMPETWVWYKATPELTVNSCFVKISYQEIGQELCGGDIYSHECCFSWFFFFPSEIPLFVSFICLPACDVLWLWPQSSCSGACPAHVPQFWDVLGEKNPPGLFGEDLDDVSPGLWALQWWLRV